MGGRHVRRLALTTGLPEDALGGGARVTLTGRTAALVEGQRGVRAVKVGGVPCSEETVLDGTYAIQRPFNMVTAADRALSESAQAFLDYATSADAADLIRMAGAVPMTVADGE